MRAARQCVMAAALSLAPVVDYAVQAHRDRPMNGVRGLFDQAIGMPVVVFVDSIRQLPQALRQSDGTWDKAAR